MAKVSSNRSGQLVDCRAADPFATVAANEANAKAAFAEFKETLKCHRKCRTSFRAMAKLLSHLSELHTKLAVHKERRVNMLASEWESAMNAYKLEQVEQIKEFICCGHLQSVGICECTQATLDVADLRSWISSAREDMLTLLCRYRDSASICAITDILSRAVVDGLAGRVYRSRCAREKMTMSGVMLECQQRDEKQLKGTIEYLIRMINATKNNEVLQSFGCMLKTALGCFLHDVSFDDLIWLTCKLMEAPSVGVDWIPSCIHEVLLSYCDSNVKLGCEYYCRFMLVVLEFACSYARPKHCPLEMCESWVLVEPTSSQDKRRKAINEEAFRPYLNLFDMDNFSAISRRICSSGKENPSEIWNQHMLFTQQLICIVEPTLKRLISRRCCDSALFLSVLICRSANYLYCMRQELSNVLTSSSVTEEVYIRLSAYKAVASVGRYSLWQAFSSMPAAPLTQVDEWRLLQVIFQTNGDNVRNVMTSALDRLKGHVREAVRTRTDSVPCSDRENILFYGVMCAIAVRLRDPDAVYITLLALLLKAFSSNDPVGRDTLEKNMLDISRTSPLFIEQFILAVDECVKRTGTTCMDMIQKVSLGHFRLNEKTWPVLKNWLRHKIESKQFACAERIIAVMAFQHRTLLDDAFTLELVDVLSHLFRKNVPDAKLADLPTFRKVSVLLGISWSDVYSNPFEQLSWMLIASVKVTAWPQSSGQCSTQRTVFPTRHSLFEAFVRFQTGHETEIAIENFLDTLTQVHFSAGILPCAIYLLCKPLVNNGASLPSPAKFHEWIDCMLKPPSSDAFDFPYGEFFCHLLWNNIAAYKETKRKECCDIVEFLLKTVCPCANKVWSQTDGILSLLNGCARILNELDESSEFFRRWFLIPKDDGIFTKNDGLAHFVAAIDTLKEKDQFTNHLLKNPDLAYVFAIVLHDYGMSIDKSVPERSNWLFAVSESWLFLCVHLGQDRFLLLRKALKRFYDITTDEESLSAWQLSELALLMDELVKYSERLKESRKELYSSLMRWVKAIASSLEPGKSLRCFPRSSSLETLLMGNEKSESDKAVAVQDVVTGSVQEPDSAKLIGHMCPPVRDVGDVPDASVAKDKNPTKVSFMIEQDGEKLMDWPNTTIMDLLVKYVEIVKDNVSPFKEIQERVGSACETFAATMRDTNVYVRVKKNKKLIYDRNPRKCRVCNSEAQPELLVEEHQLDERKREFLKHEWACLIRPFENRFDKCVAEFCANFSFFSVMLQEFTRRNDVANIGQPYSQTERLKLMELIIASSECDDIAMPPEVCSDAAKRLRQSSIKAALYHCGNEVNEILRSFFVDSTMFALMIEDLPVDLLSTDQFFLIYETFLHVLSVSEGRNVNVRMVLNVLDIAQLEAKLTSTLAMRFVHLILSTYRAYCQRFVNRNPEICSILSKHLRFLLFCQESAYFESGLCFLINEYYLDCSQLLNDTVCDLAENPKLFALDFESVCHCLDCLSYCMMCPEGDTNGLTLYRIFLCRKVDLWRASKETNGRWPSEEDLDATVEGTYLFSTGRMLAVGNDAQRLPTLLEQFYLIVRCLFDLLVEIKSSVVGTSLLPFVVTGLDYFKLSPLDDRLEKVMEGYAAHLKWNTVVPSAEIIDHFVMLMNGAKRKQKVFFIQIVVQLRWEEFVDASVMVADSAAPMVAKALHLLLLCAFCKDAQLFSSSLVDLLTLFNRVPKGMISGKYTEDLLSRFSTLANYKDLLVHSRSPQNAALRLLKYLLCFDGIAVDGHTCGELCTDSQIAFLRTILLMLDRCYANRQANAQAIEAKWMEVLEELSACVGLAENRFVYINRGKALFAHVVSFLMKQKDKKAFLIDCTIRWMKTASANPHLAHLLYSLSENLCAGDPICLLLTEECLKAYFTHSMSPSWGVAMANFAVTSEASSSLSKECRETSSYWVLYCHFLTRMYDGIDGEIDIAESGQQCAAVYQELIDKQADELLCVMYFLQLVNTISVMAEKSSTLTLLVLRQFCASLSRLLRECQSESLMSNVGLWRRSTRPTRFLLLCGLAQCFIAANLPNDLTLRDIFGENAAMSTQKLKEMTIFAAYGSTINLASEVMTKFEPEGGPNNLYKFVCETVLTLYSERCVAARCSL